MYSSSFTSKQPFKSGSGIRRCNKKLEVTFPWLMFDENLHPSLQYFLALVILRMLMSLRLMYSAILLRNIAQVLLLNYLSSQDLESGDATKSWKKLFPG